MWRRAKRELTPADESALLVTAPRQPHVATENLMRILALAVFSILAVLISAVSAVTPARAQAFDPEYPVCLQVFGPLSYNDCRFTSLAQCAPSASGRAAQCIVNPYFANAYQEPIAPSHRRHRRAH
jgi:Protein of unknown function (DUF3551)